MCCQTVISHKPNLISLSHTCHVQHCHELVKMCQVCQVRKHEYYDMLLILTYSFLYSGASQPISEKWMATQGEILQGHARYSFSSIASPYSVFPFFLSSTSMINEMQSEDLLALAYTCQWGCCWWAICNPSVLQAECDINGSWWLVCLWCGALHSGERLSSHACQGCDLNAAKPYTHLFHADINHWQLNEMNSDAKLFDGLGWHTFAFAKDLHLPNTLSLLFVRSTCRVITVRIKISRHAWGWLLCDLTIQSRELKEGWYPAGFWVSWGTDGSIWRWIVEDLQCKGMGVSWIQCSGKPWK